MGGYVTHRLEYCRPETMNKLLLAGSVILALSYQLSKCVTNGQSYCERPKDCADIQRVSGPKSGIYKIFPDKTAGVDVFCDMETDGGRWTVIQRRVNGSEDFYRNWADYMIGFGHIEHEFWLGNIPIHAILSQGFYELRIDMVGPEDEKKYAGYYWFSVGDLSTSFKLTVDGYHGDAGDHLIGASGSKFSTHDRDNDVWDKNCAVEYTGAWWYTKCHNSNLNGKYGDTDYAKGITWHTVTTYHKSLKWVEMKVRRVSRAN